MQEELIFNDEITKFKTLEDLLEDIVYRNSRLSASEIASALDKSPSELTRMIRPNAESDEYKRKFPLTDLPKLIEITEDCRIIEWLYLKYLIPEETKKRIRLQKLEKYLPVIETVLKEIKGLKKTRG